MRTYVITSVCLASFGVICTLFALAFADYPITRERHRFDSVVGLVLGCAWVAWGAHVLGWI